MTTEKLILCDLDDTPIEQSAPLQIWITDYNMFEQHPRIGQPLMLQFRMIL